MSTGTAPSFAYVGWDVVQEKTSFTHVLGQPTFTPDFNGSYAVFATAILAGSASWSEYRMVIEVFTGGQWAVRDRSSVPGATLLVGGTIQMGPATARIATEINLLAGEAMRCGLFTAGGALPLVTGSATIKVIRRGPLRPAT